MCEPGRLISERGRERGGHQHAQLLDLVVGRDPLDGRALASPPTRSRFENATGWVELCDMAHALADIAIEHQRRRLKRSQWATRCRGRSSPTWRGPSRRRLGGPPCPTRRVGDGWGRERSGG